MKKPNNTDINNVEGNLQLISIKKSDESMFSNEESEKTLQQVEANEIILIDE